jgi:hypothetical protein
LDDAIAGAIRDECAVIQNGSRDRWMSKDRPTAPPYPDYLKANAQIASDLSDEINAAVDYAQNKAKLDSLGQQLDSSVK